MTGFANTARTIAEAAHFAATDQAGKPYIGHPRRVVMYVINSRPPPDDLDTLVSIAWLHDVVEETGWTLDDLRRVGATDRIVAGVDAITQRPGEARIDYMSRVAANRDAAYVKVNGDHADNLDPDRLALLPDAVADRLRAKYTRDAFHLANAT